jgi:hypothetical protein
MTTKQVKAEAFGGLSWMEGYTFPEQGYQHRIKFLDDPGDDVVRIIVEPMQGPGVAQFFDIEIIVREVTGADPA